MKHELWTEDNDGQIFCLAGPHGDNARSLLMPGAKLSWTCLADSNFEAMTKYYLYMEWGEYKSYYPDEDNQTYKSLGWE